MCIISTSAAGITACIGSEGAPFVFQGSCNPEGVATYFEKVLLPALPNGIVWDNARFHPSPTTAALVAAAGGELLFLPAYSPALNPIEHIWASFKNSAP